MPKSALLALVLLPALAGPPFILAEEADDDFRARIFIAEPDGSGMKRLTDLPDYKYQGSPCWSRDGRLIAFDAWRPTRGETNRNARVVVVNADGTNPRVLTDGAMPSFSPRANRIAFIRHPPDSGVWVMNIDREDGDLVLLDERGMGTDWSPDGGHIAYATGGSQGMDLVVYDVVEGTRQKLFGDATPYKQIFWNFAWSPDGRQIAMKGIRKSDGKPEIGIVDARGMKEGFVQRLDADVSPALSWSADGSRLFFCQSVPERDYRLQIFTLAAEGKDPPVILPKQERGPQFFDATCSPDGKKLAISVKPDPLKK